MTMAMANSTMRYSCTMRCNLLLPSRARGPATVGSSDVDVMDSMKGMSLTLLETARGLMRSGVVVVTPPVRVREQRERESTAYLRLGSNHTRTTRRRVETRWSAEEISVDARGADDLIADRFIIIKDERVLTLQHAFGG